MAIILYFWYPCFLIEPVGAKSPTFSSDVKQSWIDRPMNHTFALLCPAQAYPVPAYR